MLFNFLKPLVISPLLVINTLLNTLLKHPQTESCSSPQKLIVKDCIKTKTVVCMGKTEMYGHIILETNITGTAI